MRALITSRKNSLKLQQYLELVHLMWQKMHMVVCHLATSSQKTKTFQNKLKTYWKHRGGHQQGIKTWYAWHVLWSTQYYHQQNVDPFQVITKVSVEYLTEYFHAGVGYSFVNTVRSVLSILIKTVNDIPFGELQLVLRL